MAITIPIISEFNDKGIKKAISEFQSLESNTDKAAFALKKSFVPAMAAIGGIAAGLGLATKAAIEDAASQDLLATQIKNATLATTDQIAANEGFIASMSMQTAIADDQLRPALANLVRATGSLEQAQASLGLVADIAIAKNIDMETASNAVGKALAGNTTALKKLDPSLSAVIKSGASTEEIFAALTQTFGGTAEAASKTAAGGMKKLKIILGETQESIGQALIPIIEKLLPALQSMAEFAQRNSDMILKVTLAIGAFATAIIAANVAIKAITIANTLFNLSLAANPIGLVVAGITLLIAALTAAYFKFEGFRNVVDAVFHAVKVGVVALVNVFKSNFNLIASIWNATLGKISFTIPSWVPGIGGKSFAMPQIPTFGGSVPSAPAAATGSPAPYLGDKDLGEKVSGSLMAAPAIVAAPSVASGGGGGGGGGGSAPSWNPPKERAAPITVNVNGGLASSAEIGQAVVNSIRAYERQNGALEFAVAI